MRSASDEAGAADRRRTRRNGRLMRSAAGPAALVLFLAGCGPNEVILPGERLELSGEAAGTTPDGPRPIALPAQVADAEWTHKAGAPDHSIQHPALRSAALAPVWSADIGAPADRRHRITADPVVAGGRVFALDSRAHVSAFSTGGAPLWARDLTPPADGPDDASGGGLAAAGRAALRHHRVRHARRARRGRRGPNSGRRTSTPRSRARPPSSETPFMPSRATAAAGQSTRPTGGSAGRSRACPASRESTAVRPRP